METAVAVSASASDVQPRTAKICVQRALDPPLQASRKWSEVFQDRGVPQPRTGDAAADRWLAAAMSPKATVARQTNMPHLPRKFVLISSQETRPADCVIEHVPLPPGRARAGNDSAVVLSFTRPALAGSYAYIEEYEECPGLCGTTYLRVFGKQKGKWVQIAKAILSVS